MGHGMTTFTITMRTKPNVDPVRALRGAIKVLGRYYGFRIMQIDEIKDGGDLPATAMDEQSIDE
jgi:hypothetical protein